VRFDFIRNRTQIVIPANTLVPSPSGDQVVVRHGVAHYQDILVATDFGPDLEVSEGVNVGDVLIQNVTDDIREGTKVGVSNPLNPGQK
jgi:hypothetical protein